MKDLQNVFFRGEYAVKSSEEGGTSYASICRKEEKTQAHVHT